MKRLGNMKQTVPFLELGTNQTRKLFKKIKKIKMEIIVLRINNFFKSPRQDISYDYDDDDDDNVIYVELCLRLIF